MTNEGLIFLIHIPLTILILFLGIAIGYYIRNGELRKEDKLKKIKKNDE